MCVHRDLGRFPLSLCGVGCFMITNVWEKNFTLQWIIILTRWGKFNWSIETSIVHLIYYHNKVISKNGRKVYSMLKLKTPCHTNTTKSLASRSFLKAFFECIFVKHVECYKSLKSLRLQSIHAFVGQTTWSTVSITRDRVCTIVIWSFYILAENQYLKYTVLLR